MFTATPCLEVHYNLWIASTSILALQIGNWGSCWFSHWPGLLWLVIELKLSSPGLLTPTLYAAVLPRIQLWVNEWMNESIMFLLEKRSEPGSQSLGRGCTLLFRPVLRTLQCLPDVHRPRCVCVSSLWPDGWRSPDAVSLTTPTWAVSGETSAMPWLDRSGGRNTSPTGALTPSLPPWFWLHHHSVSSWPGFQRLTP